MNSKTKEKSGRRSKHGKRRTGASEYRALSKGVMYKSGKKVVRPKGKVDKSTFKGMEKKGKMTRNAGKGGGGGGKKGKGKGKK